MRPFIVFEKRFLFKGRTITAVTVTPGADIRFM